MSDPIEFAYAGLDTNGTITRLTVFEGIPTHENHVINLVEAWGVNINWEMDGASLLFPPYRGHALGAAPVPGVDRHRRRVQPAGCPGGRCPGERSPARRPSPAS